MFLSLKFLPLMFLPLMKEALHHGHVEPAVEFAAHFGLHPHQPKSACLVERSGCGARGLDSGKNSMKT